MALVILKGRNGQDRPNWYGEYVDKGKRRVINLNVPIHGVRPESLRAQGDATFERTRGQAEKAFAAYLDEHRTKGRAEHLTERLIESKTGQAVKYARIDALAEQWRKLGRETAASEAHLVNCDAVFQRFVEHVKKAKSDAVHLYEVSPEMAAQFVQTLQAAYARKTVRDNVKLLNKAFERFLPVGASNPFAGLVGRRAAGESESIHRKPFTPEELQAILAASKSDDFMYPLIVTAACTGMRRGDVCNLKWEDVDLDGGMLAVKTSKTGVNVEIPIFGPLREVLEAAGPKKKGLVFPEAAAMLEANPDGLTWRFKKHVAAALDDSVTEAPTPATEIVEEGQEAIAKNIGDPVRRERMSDILSRYCAGESLRQIVTNTGFCKATVSNDLHHIEKMIGKRFMRVQSTTIKGSLKDTTQVARPKGKRAASVRDWHALRATWVTLALSAGVPVELVRRVTGHATVEVVLKHYFRPDREQFRAALVGALPEVLVGKTADRGLKTEDRIAEGYGGVKVAGPSGQLEEALEILRGVTGKANQERVARSVALIEGAKGWLDSRALREGRV